MTSTHAVVQVKNLTKTYTGGATALQGVNFELKPGTITGLVGENGCGKTTLLKIIAGVLSDWDGTVLIEGEKPGASTKAQVAFLPASDFLDPMWDANKAIDVYSRFYSDFSAEKVREGIDYFGLQMDQQLKSMSKGMGEKLQIALLMARSAELYLLDEPLSGVDPAVRDTIMQGILRDFNPDSAMLISTHLIADVEQILDDVIMMRAGTVLVHANVDDLRAEYGLSLEGIFKKEYR